VLAASFISFPNEMYMNGHILTGDGARAMELIKNNFFKDAITLYETGGDFPTIYDPTAALSKETFIKEIEDAKLIVWDAHGSQTGAYTETWLDKNKNGLPDTGEFTYTPFISASDTFETHAIVFSASCLNLNGDNNLGKSFINNGAIAFIGARELHTHRHILQWEMMAVLQALCTISRKISPKEIPLVMPFMGHSTFTTKIYFQRYRRPHRKRTSQHL